MVRHQQKAGMGTVLAFLAGIFGGGCSDDGGKSPPPQPISVAKTPEGQVNVQEDVTFDGHFDSVDLDARVDSDGDGDPANDPDAAPGETVQYGKGGIYVATAHLGSEKVEERVVVKPYAIFSLVEQVDQFPYPVDLVGDDAWAYILAAIPDQSFADELQQLDLVKGSADTILGRAFVADGVHSGIVYHVKFGVGSTVGFPHDEALCEQQLSGTLLAYMGSMLEEQDGRDAIQMAVPNGATVTTNQPLTIAPFSFTPELTIERAFPAGTVSIVGIYFGSSSDPVSAADMTKITALNSVQQGGYNPFTVMAIPATGQGGATRFEILRTLGERFAQDDLNH